MRILRPDCVILAIKNLIKIELGEEFIIIPSFDLDAAFVDSKSSTPIIYVLAHGIDPLEEILSFAEKQNKAKS